MSPRLTSVPANPPQRRPVTLMVVVGLCLLAAACAWRWHPAPQDDAFISFRYAENLAAGHGLVFNDGEWVEGYSNLLWTLLAAMPIRAGWDPVQTMAAVGVAALVGMVATAGVEARRQLGGIGAVVAALMVACDLKAGLEAVEGLETTFYALVLGLGVVQLLRETAREEAGWGAHFGSSVLFGLAWLTRPEAPLLAGLAHLGVLAAAQQPRGRARPLGGAVAVACGVGVALTAWRLMVYGQPLPNTFYAKTGGLAMERGWMYLWTHAVSHPVLWGLVCLRVLMGRRTTWTRPAAFMVVGQVVYILVVGGDFKPTGRFVIPVLIPMAILAAEAVVGLGARHERAGRAVSAVVVLGALTSGWLMGQDVRRWSAERHADYQARRTVGEYLAGHFPPDTVMAIHSAGCIPYFSRLPTIDMWGLTDAHIARAPVDEFGQGLAGHERSDPDYVFARKPDLYLPEAHLFTLQPHPLEPGRGFPDDFTEQYKAITIPVDGRALNLWVRRGFIASVNRAQSGD